MIHKKILWDTHLQILQIRVIIIIIYIYIAQTSLWIYSVALYNIVIIIKFMLKVTKTWETIKNSYKKY